MTSDTPSSDEPSTASNHLDRHQNPAVEMETVIREWEGGDYDEAPSLIGAGSLSTIRLRSWRDWCRSVEEENEHLKAALGSIYRESVPHEDDSGRARKTLEEIHSTACHALAGDDPEDGDDP